MKTIPGTQGEGRPGLDWTDLAVTYTSCKEFGFCGIGNEELAQDFRGTYGFRGFGLKGLAVILVLVCGQ